MFFKDFEYDGVKLSDMDFVICSFDGGRDMETVPNGGDLTFNTVSEYNGKHWLLTNSIYEEALTATFHICPDPCKFQLGDPIDEQTNRKIMRWLNRRTYNKFKPIIAGSDVHFFGSFIVKGQLFNGNLIGYELTLQTDRPFGIGDPVTISFEIGQGETYSFEDTSDEIGYIYPKMEVTLKSAGTLNIYNSIEPEWGTTIMNCISGEKITFDHPMISTSMPSHKIQEDFDYNFPRICNTYTNNLNQMTFSLPCDVTMTYSPVRKVGL